MTRTLTILMLVMIIASPLVALEWYVDVDFDEGTYKELGSEPVVADINRDGNTEFIVSGPFSIHVIDKDGDDFCDALTISQEEYDPNYGEVVDGPAYNHQNDPDEWNAYRMLDSPSLGDLNGDGYLDIVATASVWIYFDNHWGDEYTYCPFFGPGEWHSPENEEDGESPCHHPFYYFYCWLFDPQSGEFEDPIVSDDDFPGNPGVPAIFDTDADGKDEVFLYGTFGAWSHEYFWFGFESFKLDAQEDLVHNTGFSWAASAIDDGDIVIDEDDGYDLGVSICVGDLDADGVVEYVGCNAAYLECKTVSENVFTNKNGFPLSSEDVFGVENSYFLGRQIALGDINNDGDLEIVCCGNVWNAQQEAYQGKITFVNSAGDVIFNEMLIGETFNISQQSSPAMFDHLDDGHLGVTVMGATNLGVMEYRTNPQIGMYWLTNYPRLVDANATEPGWATPAVADVITAEGYSDIEILLPVYVNSGQLRAYSSEDADDYTTLGQDANLRYFSGSPLTPWIGLLSLGDGENPDIYAIGLSAQGRDPQDPFSRLQDVVEYNNFTQAQKERIEWGQYKNGPRHTGLYAQCYEGGYQSVIFRDRCIITGNTSMWGLDFFINHSSPTVVEFNEGSRLTLGYVEAIGPIAVLSSCSGPYRAIFKGNNYNEEHPEQLLSREIWVMRAPEDWGNDGMFSFSNTTFQGINFTVAENCSLEFENCMFSSDGLGDGDWVCFTGEDTYVKFSECTFTGYDVALSLDGCTGSIEDCTFEGNNGNAVEMTDIGSTLGFEITNCTFTGNGGSAIYMYDADPIIEDCIISENDCDYTGAAIYCYNSSPELRNNYVHDNLYAGIRNTAGGGAVMGNTIDFFTNRFEDNNTYTHTADSTWAEAIQVHPSGMTLDWGHNDFVNGGGDYLISKHNYGSAMLYASGNYWEPANPPVSSSDFYGYVDYSYPDQYPNYSTSSFEEDAAAHPMFMHAILAADTGSYAAAWDTLETLLDSYPETPSGLLALRKLFEWRAQVDVSLNDLYDIYQGFSESAYLHIYADRMATLCLVGMGEFEDAIDHYDNVLDEIESQPDSIYYAIDRAYALIAQMNDEDVPNNDARDVRKHAITAHKRDLTRLTAALNGLPEPDYSQDGWIPLTHRIIDCYPNPFNNSAYVKYELVEAARVKLQVFDSTGRLTATLMDGDTPAGTYTTLWDAGQAANGVYLVRLEAGGRVDSRSLTLVK